MINEQAYAKGARCGYIEGKGRAGQYVIGEAEEIADDASMNQGLDSLTLTTWWAKGYIFGYKKAAEGLSLPEYLTI